MATQHVACEIRFYLKLWVDFTAFIFIYVVSLLRLDGRDGLWTHLVVSAYRAVWALPLVGIEWDVCMGESRLRDSDVV